MRGAEVIQSDAVRSFFFLSLSLVAESGYLARWIEIRVRWNANEAHQAFSLKLGVHARQLSATLYIGMRHLASRVRNSRTLIYYVRIVYRQKTVKNACDAGAIDPS